MDSAEDVKNAPEKKIPSLLDLPGEIRNRIYKLLLVEEVPVQVALREEDRSGLWQPSSRHLRYSLPHIKRSKSSKHHLAITTTCKQIREESLSLFLGSNTFVVKFCDPTPATTNPRLCHTFTQTRTLHLRGWLSYLGDLKKHLSKVEVHLGLYRNNFDPASLIDSIKDIKAAFPRAAVLTITADIAVESYQTVSRPAVPNLRVTTSANSLAEALEGFERDVKAVRNWITFRDEGKGGHGGYYALMWKHDSVRDLGRTARRAEALLRRLDGDPAWRWNKKI